MIWNISPAYFSDEDLLCEIDRLKYFLENFDNDTLKNDKDFQFYYKNSWELKYRIKSIAAELTLRGISTVDLQHIVISNSFESISYEIEPFKQFEMLKSRYKNRNLARVLVPKNAQQLWANHKYSIMARDVNLYRAIGKSVASNNDMKNFKNLSKVFIEKLRQKPKAGGITNTLHHMWGYISNILSLNINELSSKELFYEILKCVMKSNQNYLIKQTAISELELWIN